ncbi:RCC1 domain-containing protein [Yersinia bercovieri]|uniref:RCC1 domain-containing protein n=1 Tax=Yersinia bercovieri TaxID=634 RepID=UPI00119F68EB|nr:hypothetical protein [Yersinia bercovieri]
MTNTHLSAHPGEPDSRLDTTLPAPGLRESAGGAIQLSELGTKKTVNVDILPWPGMAGGQYVTLRWWGVLPDINLLGPNYNKGKAVSAGTVDKVITFPVDIATYLKPYADGGTLYLSYDVDGVYSEEEHIGVDVPPVSQLAAPEIEEALAGEIDPLEPELLTLTVPPWPGMAAKDKLSYLWRGSPPSGDPVTLTDSMPVPRALVGEPVSFDCEAAEGAQPFDGGTVEVWYEVEPVAGGDTQVSLHQTYRVGEAAPLTAPVIEEADGDQLDPERLIGGAQVRISYPLIAAGDRVQLEWMPVDAAGTPGQVYKSPANLVSTVDVAQGYIRVQVPTAQIDPYLGGSVDLRYAVNDDRLSAITHYGIQKLVHVGNLWVVGARGSSASYHQGSGCLVAQDQTTRALLKAHWQYEGLPEVSTDVRFIDTHPELELVVSVGTEVVRLRPQNIALSSGACAVVLNDGSVAAWGGYDYPGDAATVASLRDIVQVVGGQSTFEALGANGSVAAWGYDFAGGKVPPAVANLRNIVQVVAGGSALAARCADGSVVAWAKDANNGGTVPPAVAGLRDIVQVVGGLSAFAALRADGSLVAWGNPDDGGTVSPAVAGLRDIVQVVGGDYAFAALRANGSVVAYPYYAFGGDTSSVAGLTDIVQVVAGETAFAALRANGSVVAWGSSDSGGTVSSEVAGLSDIVLLVGSGSAFAALRADGSVVAWGDPARGGTVSKEVAGLSDIVLLVGSSYAFAALRANGSVVAWGNPDLGGTVPTEITALHNLRAVYGGYGVLAVLDDAGVPTSWSSVTGSPPAGVAGNVSYTLPERPKLRQLK